MSVHRPIADSLSIQQTRINALQIYWSQPAFLPSGCRIAYQLQLRAGANSPTVHYFENEGPHVITQLAWGVKYTFIVRFMAYGFLVPTQEYEQSMSMQANANPMERLSIVPFYKGLYIKWVPFSIAGQRLDHYRILLNNGSKQITEYQEDLEFTELKVINLVECSPYDINVQACVGTGCTDYLSARRPRAVPYMQVHRPIADSLSIQQTRINALQIYWSQPAFLPSGCRIAYQLQLRAGANSPTVHYFENEGPHVITQLAWGVKYTFIVRFMAYGFLVPTQEYEQSMSMQANANPMERLSIVPFYKGLYIKWVPFSIAGQRLDHYRILLNNGSKQITEYQEDLEFTELKVINLVECSPYDINVQACVGTGCTDYLSARAVPYMQVPPTSPPPHVIAWSKTEHVVYWSDDFGLPTQCNLRYRLRIIINDGQPNDIMFMHSGPHRIGPIQPNAYYSYSIQLQMDVTLTGSWSEQQTIATPAELTYPIKLDIQNSNFGEQKIVWVFTESQYRHESSNRYYLLITWLGGQQNVAVAHNQPLIRTDLKQNVEYTYVLYVYMKTDVLVSNTVVISTLPTSGPVQVDELQATPIRFGIYIAWTTIDRFFLTFRSFLVRIVPNDASVRVVEFQTTGVDRTLTDLLPCVTYNVSICAFAQNGICSSPTFTQVIPYPSGKNFFFSDYGGVQLKHECLNPVRLFGRVRPNAQEF
ncbi:hypothetical protein AHF37_02092 [Paragonimus kellicotti]|nr:hypothetical protein AHF37_02092 [Paragonimus kellicotti]